LPGRQDGHRRRLARPLPVMECPKPDPGQHRWLALALLLLGLWVLDVDQMVTALVLPEIASDLNGDLSQAGLSLTLFTAAASSSVILMGRLADGLGRSRMVVAGLGGLAVGSLITGLAPSLPVLLLGRAL
jgi:predicted MFS family arabinose efflux permease